MQDTKLHNNTDVFGGICSSFIIMTTIKVRKQEQSVPRTQLHFLIVDTQTIINTLHLAVVSSLLRL